MRSDSCTVDHRSGFHVAPPPPPPIPPPPPPPKKKEEKKKKESCSSQFHHHGHFPGKSGELSVQPCFQVGRSVLPGDFWSVGPRVNFSL